MIAELEIDNKVKQDDVLSVTLFKLIYEEATRVVDH